MRGITLAAGVVDETEDAEAQDDDDAADEADELTEEEDETAAEEDDAVDALPEDAEEDVF